MKENKYKIKSSVSGPDKKKIDIKRVLRDNPQGLTPKYISLYSGVNYSTVKTILGKMQEVKRKDGLEGHYILLEKHSHGIFDCKIQNLRLSCCSDKINIKERICEVNSLNCIIKFRFEVGLKSKKATMTIGTDYPLDFACLGLLGCLFQGLIEKHCNFIPDMNQIFVNTFEINKDYFNIALEGCNSIRLDTLLFEYKLYHKEKTYTREEYKLKFPLNLAFITSLVDKGLFYTETNQKMGELAHEIETLKKEITLCTRGIYSLLENKQKL